jgi:predicted aldo/keto reductase-like oxidoreductase
MLYRKAPKTGDELSILGFGCMRLPLKDGRIDEERATRQLRHAIDRGVNYVDTAWPYHGGESEPFVGRALAGGYRERVRVATKLPAWLVQSRADMDRYLDAQLEKLATSRIDYYLVHSLNGPAWERMAALGAGEFLGRARADGRIGNAGFSFHGAPHEFPRIVDGYPWEFCQIQYNYLDTERQAGTAGLRYAASKRLAVIVMEPLRGGMLGGEPPAPVAALWHEAERPRSPAEWALRWVWDHPEVTVVLSGMNDETQIEENLATAAGGRAGSLTAAETELVARAGAKYREIMKVECTGCSYCLPCPSGVDIPSSFDAFNVWHTFGKPQQANFSYIVRAAGIFTRQPAYASLCSRCMDCEEKCPQSLPIPDLLDQVAALFEGEGFREREAMIRRMLQN